MNWTGKVRKDLRIGGLTILAVLVLLGPLLPVSAGTIEIQPGWSEMLVDGNSVRLEASPYLKHGRTMVPLNMISDGFNATVDTFQTEDGLQVRILLDHIKIFLLLGARGAHFIDQFNRESVTRMDVAAEMIDGQVFVPLCFIAQDLGASINWDPGTGCINIRRES